jgi:prevent-host-death family protein
MPTTISATEARVHFGEIMQDALRSQQPIVVEKAGKPQVVILAFERYQQLVSNEQEDWQTMLANVHAMIKADLQGGKLSSAVEMVEAGRRARDEELADLR